MIAIISAMSIENDAILALCKDISEINIANRKFYRATLSNQQVVCCLSGVGKVNAAITTTLLLEHFPIDVILNIGTAGGLKKEEQVLDCVISTCVVEHDYDTSLLDGDKGKGCFFEADQRIVNIVKSVAEEMHIPYHIGLIASGDQFVADKKQISRILDAFPQSLCSEMEAAGIAKTAQNYGVPFVVIRSLSDIAVHEGNEMDFVEYAKTASERSAHFCEKCCVRLAIK